MRTTILLPYPLLTSQEKSEAGAALFRQQVRNCVPHLYVRRVFYEATRQPRSAVATSIRPVDSVRPLSANGYFIDYFSTHRAKIQGQIYSCLLFVCRTFLW
jgi:hypothetical protein